MKKKLGAVLLAVVLVLTLGLVMAAPVGANPDPGLVGLWHFDTDANDSTANHNDGTLMGNAYLTTGYFGNAVSLDGSGDYVTVADSASLDISGAITVEAWVNVSSYTSGKVYTIAGKWNDMDGNYRACLLALSTKENGSPLPKFYISSNGTNFDSAVSPDSLSSGTWYHLAGTFDGDVLKIYVDGVEKGSKDTTLTSIVLNNQPLLIGGDRAGGAEGNGYFNGLIDEVRIWDEALTADQIGDVDPPVVTINAPDDGAYYQTSAVPAAAYDVDDANSYTVEETGYSTAEGVHTYTVTTTDVLGYVGSASVTYTVDNTKPVVNITAPADGGFYPAGAVPALVYTVTDNLDPSPTVVESGYSTDPGEQTVTVTATDAAGNAGSDSVTYYVLENFVTGGGTIKSGKTVAWAFAGTVGNLEDGSVGQFQIVDHANKISYHCNNNFSSALVFSGGLATSPPASHNIATFTGTFTNNRNATTVAITVTIQDLGEPGAGVDKITISGGLTITEQTISGGNFQVHDIE